MVEADVAAPRPIGLGFALVFYEWWNAAEPTRRMYERVFQLRYSECRGNGRGELRCPCNTGHAFVQEDGSCLVSEEKMLSLVTKAGNQEGGQR